MFQCVLLYHSKCSAKYQCPPEGQHTPLQEVSDTEVIKQNRHDRTVASVIRIRLADVGYVFPYVNHEAALNLR